jgi:hypothetical protein
MRDGQNGAPRSRIGLRRNAGGAGVFADLDVARAVDAVDEEPSIRGILRMEGEAEQALLAGRAQFGVRHVEERRERSGRKVKARDAPGVLLDQVERIGVARRGGAADEGREPRRHADGVDPPRRRRYVAAAVPEEDVVAGEAEDRVRSVAARQRVAAGRPVDRRSIRHRRVSLLRAAVRRAWPRKQGTGIRTIRAFWGRAVEAAPPGMASSAVYATST